MTDATAMSGPIPVRPTAEPKNRIPGGVACLAMLLRFHGQAADPSTLAHRIAAAEGELDEVDIVRAARAAGLKAKVVATDWDRLDKTPLPALGRFRTGEWFVLGKANGKQALIQEPTGPPKLLGREEFEARWDGRLILMTTRASLAGALRKFDISWFVPSLVKYRRILAEVLVVSFFLQVVGLITPLFFQVVIDKVLVHRGLSTLDVLLIGLIAVTLFETLLGGLRSYTFSHTTSRIDVELGARMFGHTLSLPIAYFNARRVGETVARARELENIRAFLTGSALTVVLDVFFTVVFFAVMLFYSPLLTAVVAATIPLYAIISFAIAPVLRRKLESKFEKGAENQAFLVEAISGVETLKALAVEPRMQRRWEDQLAAYVKAGFEASNLANWGGQAIQLVNKLSLAVILWIGAKLVMDGSLSIGELVAFNMLAGRVGQPILRLAQLWQDVQQFGLSIARLGDILNAPPEPKPESARGGLPAPQGRIAFEHVNFRYRADGQRILEDVTFDVAPGQFVGVVGSSGSGKSTLTKLVQRLYSPESGRVLVDGVDLAMVDPAWLRQNIGVVLQENVLFNRSVRDNIAMSDPAMPMEAVIGAARLAGAHDFILQLPQGYDTQIGERGTTLSGGQRQRIAIARALIGDPRILIFDEATSALDYESERIIQENMRAICANRTVLVIAHRLAALRGAHRIVTIEKGRVVEDGPHEQLLRRNGRYAELYRMQFPGEPMAAGRAGAA
jgi:subfamily B ATP-binding cassette protein HlyB/CyaB